MIRAYQNADGGWGESCASYDKHLHARPSTAIADGMGDLGLLAGGDTRRISLHKAVEYLLENQRPDGNWDEEYCDRHGFPSCFLSDL